jgi:hypothetical protein
MDDIGKSRRDIIVGSVASHVLAGVTGFVGLLAWFKLRTVQSVLVIVTDVTTWAWRFIDMASFMIFGLIWLIVVLFSQHYYQKGYEKKSPLAQFQPDYRNNLFCAGRINSDRYGRDAGRKDAGQYNNAGY